MTTDVSELNRAYDRIRTNDHFAGFAENDDSLKELEIRCITHDWAYMMSDVHIEWKMGYESNKKIHECLESLKGTPLEEKSLEMYYYYGKKLGVNY